MLVLKEKSRNKTKNIILYGIFLHNISTWLTKELYATIKQKTKCCSWGWRMVENIATPIYFLSFKYLKGNFFS